MRFSFLKGVKVVEFGRVLSAPYASKLLSDMGAKVTKIEAGRGDPYRHLPPLLNGESIWFQNYNHGKETLRIDDLKDWKCNDEVLESIKNADIFLENYKPGTLDKIGLGYKSVKSINEKIVYVSISAFGQNGSFREHPGYDLIVESEAGYLLDFPDGEASYPHTFLSDYASGLLAAFSSIAALRKGVSTHIDVSMFDLLANWSLILNVVQSYDKGFSDRIFRMDAAAFPYGVYQSSNRQKIAVAAVGESVSRRFYEAFADKFEKEDIRFEEFLSPNNFNQLNKKVSSVLNSMRSEDIMNRLETNNVPCSIVKPGIDLLNSPLVREKKLFDEVEIDGTRYKLLRIPVETEED